VYWCPRIDIVELNLIIFILKKLGFPELSEKPEALLIPPEVSEMIMTIFLLPQTLH